MVVFTGPDKALLDRAARLVDAQAKALRWESIEDARKRKAAKLEFDRLTRDARDLRALALRLKAAVKFFQAATTHLQVSAERASKPPMIDSTGAVVTG